MKYGRQKEYLLQLNVFERWQCLNLWSHTFNFYHSLGKFRRQQIDILLIFSRKQVYKFHVNFLSWRQFVWNVKTCFLGKIRKIFQASICWNIYPAYNQRRQTDKKIRNQVYFIFLRIIMSTRVSTPQSITLLLGSRAKSVLAKKYVASKQNCINYMGKTSQKVVSRQLAPDYY